MTRSNNYGQDSLSRALAALELVLEEARKSGSSLVSGRTYKDEPIIQLGSSLRKSQTGQPASTQQANSKTDPDRQARSNESQTSTASTREERARARQQAREQRPSRMRHSQEQQMHYRPDASQNPYKQNTEDSPKSSFSFDDSFWNWSDASSSQTFNALPWDETPAQTVLPDTLRQVRTLAQSRDEEGQVMRGGPLFVAQARLAADYTDEMPYEGSHPYLYLPTYQELDDRELRGYFTWRGSWRAGNALSAPANYATILAFELINGIGTSSDKDTLAQLTKLANTCATTPQGSYGPSVEHDIRRWARDFALIKGLPVTSAMTDEQIDFEKAVMTLRAAEAWAIADNTSDARTTEDSDTQALPTRPAASEVFSAMGEISTMDIEHSPFFRSHREAAATVSAGVFNRMCIHCHRRRKTGFVDGIVGFEYAVPFEPLAGVPREKPWESPERVVRISPGCTVSHHFGRWKIRYAYERDAHSRDLSIILRAIDRQMRHDWDFGHELKGRPIPRYLDRFIVQEAEACHEAEHEAELHRFTVDFSKLGGIRSAAAITAEALLVDEEREDVTTDETKQPEDLSSPATKSSEPVEKAELITSPASQSTAESASTNIPPDTAAEESEAVPSGSDVTSGQAAGLTPTELAVAQALLAGKDPAGLIATGGPTIDMVIDSINEKLFDQIGDVSFEYVDGTPVVVEDYKDDLKGMLA